MPFGDMGPDEDLLGVDCTEVFPGHPGRGWMWRSREPPWPEALSWGFQGHKWEPEMGRVGPEWF